jgi:HK97 gp10 family phage protein
MADVVLETRGFNELISKLDRLPKVVFKDMGYAILTCALLVEATAKDNVKKAFHMVSSAADVAKGGGHLADSIGHKILKVGGLAVTGVVGTNLVYAAIQEFGGTVKAKNVKYLTIPWDGVTGWAKDYKNTFVHESKAGNLIIFQRVSKDEIKPLFTLKDQIEIPPRPYLNPAIKSNERRIIEIISDALNRSFASLASADMDAYLGGDF